MPCPDIALDVPTPLSASFFLSMRMPSFWHFFVFLALCSHAGAAKGGRDLGQTIGQDERSTVHWSLGGADGGDCVYKKGGRGLRAVRCARNTFASVIGEARVNVDSK